MTAWDIFVTAQPSSPCAYVERVFEYPPVVYRPITKAGLPSI